MKFVKFIFICVISFFVLLTAISLFIPSRVTISRAINIAPGSDSVLSQVGDLKNWKNWHPQFSAVVLNDKVTKEGRIEQAIASGVLLTVTTFNDSVATVEMKKGEKPVFNNWRLIRHEQGDSLTLQNYMDFKFSWYPWEKFSSLMFEASYGPVMEKGLQNLRDIPR